MLIENFVLKDKIKIYNPGEKNLYDGAFSFICREEGLLSRIKTKFGRENQKDLCLKIFHCPLVGRIEDFLWGKVFVPDESHSTSKLIEAVKIQNLCAFEGIAPRVYALFTLEWEGKRYPTLLVRDMGKDSELDADKRMEQSRQIASFIWSIGCIPFRADMTPKGNVVGGLWVDFQGSKFGHDYEDRLKDLYLNTTYFGESKYQTVPELGIAAGIRKSDIRYHDLGLDSYDFAGKTVIDIGCSGGVFLNYAMERGAKRAVGLDWERVITGAREVSNYLGHLNIDYHACDLNKPLPAAVLELAPYDLVIFTSMITHVGVPDYLFGLGKELVLEINHDHQVDETMKKMLCGYKCKILGRSSDFGNRIICWCKAKKAPR